MRHFYGTLCTGPKWELWQLESWHWGQKYFCFLKQNRIMGTDQLTFVWSCRPYNLNGWTLNSTLLQTKIALAWKRGNKLVEKNDLIWFDGGASEFLSTWRDFVSIWAFADEKKIFSGFLSEKNRVLMRIEIENETLPQARLIQQDFNAIKLKF